MTPHGFAARAPLAGVDLPAGVTEVPFLAQLDVRVDPADEDTLGRIATVLGFPLPVEPNTVTTSADGSRRAAWLGPDEWLVLGEPGSADGLEAALSSALADATGAGGAVVDVSAGRTTISLAGPRARALLEHGCSLDIDPRVFGPGRCAQTLLARANIVLVAISDAPDYWILVRPSLAAYVVTWIADAAGG
jgi:sarcosine oxidase subunit gamma